MARPHIRPLAICTALALTGLAAAAVAPPVLSQPAPAQPAPRAAQPAGPPPGSAPVVPPGGPAPGPAVGAPVTEEAPPLEIAPPPLAIPPAETPIAEVEPEPEPEPARTAEKKTEPEPPPIKRSRYPRAVIQALDKVTGESIRFEAEVGRPVRYKSLIFTVRACERATDEELVEDAVAYLLIQSQPRPVAGRPTPSARQAFRGWMYASSPSLNPLEHPVYDAWVITCRAAAPS